MLIMPELVTDAELRETLASARVIAVLGAHDEPSRQSFYVPDYLYQQGYRIIPVNPALVGRSLWGEPVRRALAEINEPVDIVDVFRRPELLSSHTADILAMRPPPRVVWLQLGIRNDAFTHDLEAANLSVVQDRCTLADHRRFGIGPVARL